MDKNLKKEIEEIKALMKSKKVFQKNISLITGLHQPYISKILNGKHNNTYATISKIRKAVEGWES